VGVDVRYRTVGAFLALLLITCGYYLIFFNQSLQAYEDAAMLMRYAQHVADGQGMVWNIGEKPIDGATDFLFTLVVAFFIKLGFSLNSSVHLIVMGSHILTVWLVYWAIIRYHKVSTWVAFASALYVAVGPAQWYVATYFGTPFFALVAALTWVISNEYMRDSRRLWSVAFAFSCLTLGLIRPEGVFLSLFILAATVYTKGMRKSKTLIIDYVIVFAVLGGLFFLWRWSYFGYPLPNTFYKKGGGHIFINGLENSLRNFAVLTLPFILFFGLALRDRGKMKAAVSALMPLVLFTLIWLFLAPDMNFMMRFQYAIMPILMISWPGMLGGLWISKRTWPVLALLFVGLLAGRHVLFMQHYDLSKPYQDGRYDAALMLAAYDHNYTMAVTEAGQLPLYSGWKAIDTWGPNDQYITHMGYVDGAYLDEYKPQLIMVHANYGPLNGNNQTKEWDKMVANLVAYARARNYTLAADYPLYPSDGHLYYVRSDFKDSAEIIAKLRGMRYMWDSSDEPIKNQASTP